MLGTADFIIQILSSVFMNVKEIVDPINHTRSRAKLKVFFGGYLGRLYLEITEELYTSVLTIKYNYEYKCLSTCDNSCSSIICMQYYTFQ